MTVSVEEKVLEIRWGVCVCDCGCDVCDCGCDVCVCETVCVCLCSVCTHFLSARRHLRDFTCMSHLILTAAGGVGISTLIFCIRKQAQRA